MQTPVILGPQPTSFPCRCDPYQLASAHVARDQFAKGAKELYTPLFMSTQTSECYLRYDTFIPFSIIYVRNHILSPLSHGKLLPSFTVGSLTLTSHFCTGTTTHLVSPTTFNAFI